MFKCECDCESFEEVLVNSVILTDVCDITDDGDLVYGEQTTTYGEVELYQCKDCGEPLKDADGNVIKDVETLVENYWNKDEAGN